ncbi:MAG: amino acid racemase [Candidatus Dormiibacterota bacterium]
MLDYERELELRAGTRLQVGRGKSKEAEIVKTGDAEDSRDALSPAAMKRTVGVIGGMGPAATVDFLARIIAATPAERDQDHLHVLVDCDPAVPDRTAYLRREGPDPRPALIAMASRLELAGADFLVMPCNTAHAFADDIRAKVAIPLVDWPSVVADAVAATGVTQVGILASTGTLMADVYRGPLERRGLRAVVPTPPAQAKVMRAIYGSEGVKHLGPASPVARQDLLSGALDVIAQGTGALILACTEFSAISAVQSLEAKVPVLDASQIVARHVVARALGLAAMAAAVSDGAGR